MKNKIISLISGLSLVSGLAVSPVAFASNSADLTKSLAGSTALELPTKAASLVAQTSAADRQSVTIAVVKAAIGLNPAVAADVVSALVRQNPALAPVVAVTAVTLQHKQIGLITKAATAAAPSEATKIVAALMKEFPTDYGVIAMAAAEGAPAAGREILAVIAQYVPGLQAFIQSATANADVPVPAIISQAVASGVVATTDPQPTQPTTPVTPSFSPPTITPGGFVTFPGAPGSFTPGQYGTVGPGTRHAYGSP
jgi:hypothetical protein